MTPTGYATIPRSVIARIGDIGPVPFAVLAVLAGHAGEAGECWPSLETIARMVGVTDRTVRSAIRVLEAAGLLVANRRRRETTVYRIILDRKPASGQGPILDRKSGTGQGPRPEKNDRLDRKLASGRTNTKELTPRTKAQDRKPASGQGFDPAVELPFHSEPFRTAWADFAEHRRSIRKRLTARATTLIFTKLAGWGEQRAIEALHQSIESGWTGVFEPRGGNGKPAASFRVPSGKPYVFKASDSQ